MGTLSLRDYSGRHLKHRVLLISYSAGIEQSAYQLFWGKARNWGLGSRVQGLCWLHHRAYQLIEPPPNVGQSPVVAHCLWTGQALPVPGLSCIGRGVVQTLMPNAVLIDELGDSGGVRKIRS